MMDSTSQDASISLQLYPHQVSGKQPKLLYQCGSKILKGFNQNQYSFYRIFQDSKPNLSLHNLLPFIPKFFGKLQLPQIPKLQIGSEQNKLWLNHLASRYRQRNQSNGFIILQNLTYNYAKANVFDIKIGGRNVQGKKHKITKSVFEYFIKLNGCMIANNEGDHILFTKYFLAEITQFKQMCIYFGFYFSNKNKLMEWLVVEMTKKLEQLLISFKQVRGFRFISTSLCFIYDCSTGATDIRLIDFGRVMFESNDFVDRQSIQGAQNVLKMLKQLLEKRQFYQIQFQSIAKRCKQQLVTIIPERKKAKDKSPQGRDD